MTQLAESPAELRPPSSSHPLEPLTAMEIEQATGVVKAEPWFTATTRFITVNLQEPEKSTLAQWQPGDPMMRQAIAVCLDRANGRTYEALVDLVTKTIVSYQHLPGVQPSYFGEEFTDAVAAVKADPAWQAAMARRGITEFELVQIDPWTTGNFLTPGDEGRRMTRALSYLRTSPTDNGYARPIEGVVAFVDMNRGEVLRVEDYGVRPIPPLRGSYFAADNGPQREDIKPLEIHQPEGASFVVDGHEIRWQKWRFRISMHPLDGLVLHTISYNDAGRERSILYRAALAEMVVPYGDPSPAHYWKNAFDGGEYGIGKLVNSLELGCDCLGEIRYFDAPFVSGDGSAYTQKNAICLHEEDFGILWKHFDDRGGTTEVRRSRRLVVSSIHTVGNYEYGFFWYFYQDGTLQLEVKMTGILQTQALMPGEVPGFGVTIAPGLAAPHHQHLFNFRLDFDIEGTANELYELDVEGVDDPAISPHGNAIVQKATKLASESASPRMNDFAKSRSWKVVNPAVTNHIGQPVGYRLVPAATPAMLARPDSQIARRAAFATKNLWATQYEASERRAAGDYPNMHVGGAGLPEYIAKDRSLDGTDLVVWYTFGTTHVARPEDWPVMPTEYLGFTLKPAGFFDRNPALDVPPSVAACHDEGGA